MGVRPIGAGRTVTMIAYRLSTVVAADEIVVLDRDRVVERGTHAQLTAEGGLYASMWRDYEQAARWKIEGARVLANVPAPTPAAEGGEG